MSYAERLTTCIGCEHSAPHRAKCGRDGASLHDHATHAACPDQHFPGLATPITVKGSEVVSRPAPAPVPDAEVSRRREVCRGCEHAGAEGADGRSIYCGTCPSCNGGRGRMVSLAVGTCPEARW